MNDRYVPAVLVIEDQEEIQLSAKFLLRKLFPVIDVCSMPATGLEKLKAREYDVILLDMNFSRGKTEGEEGLLWLKKLMQARPDTVIVLMTAFGDVELAIKSIKNGAFDFIIKPWNNVKFCETLSEALRYSQAKAKGRVKSEHGETMAGKSSSWLEVLAKAERVATTGANVLLLGENGTGKDLIADFIHQHSTGKKESYIMADLGTISEGDFDEEIQALVVAAKGGTLLLNDLGSLHPAMQFALVKIVQEEADHSKANEERVRFICATNANLNAMVAGGQFRKDLYYLLNTVEINIPSLRERGEDIIEIASFYLRLFREKYHRTELQFSETSLSAIMKYRWPGNVSELKRAVERAVILSADHEIEPEDLIVAESGGVSESEEHLMSLEEVEMSMIKKVLAKHGGVISHAANELGLTRASLYRRLEKYGL